MKNKNKPKLKKYPEGGTTNKKYSLDQYNSILGKYNTINPLNPKEANDVKDYVGNYITPNTKGYQEQLNTALRSKYKLSPNDTITDQYLSPEEADKALNGKYSDYMNNFNAYQAYRAKTPVMPERSVEGTKTEDPRVYGQRHINLFKPYTVNTEKPTFAKGGIKYPDGGIVASAADQEQIDSQKNRNLNAGQYMAIGQGVMNTTSSLATINNSDYSNSEKQVANGQAINQGVDTVAGSVLPWYQYAQMGKGAAKSVIGNKPESSTNRAWNALATPMHEQAITDATKGNYIDAAGDILGAGLYAPIKSYYNKDNIYANGGITSPNAEVEKQEVMRMPNGQTAQVDGPSHENGGVPVNIPSGTQVFSDRLKHPVFKKTFADIAAKYKTDKQDKLIADDNVDALTKKTAKLILETKQRKLSEIFQTQEALKQAKVAGYAKKMGMDPNSMFGNGGTKLPKLAGVQPYNTDGTFQPMQADDVNFNPNLINRNSRDEFANQVDQDTNNGTFNDTNSKYTNGSINPSYDNTKPQNYNANPNSFNYTSLIEPAANTLLQNAGNIKYLADQGKNYDKEEFIKYNPSMLSAKEELRNADIQARVTRDRLKDMTGGNAGQYMSNLVGAQTANTLNKAQIQQSIDNTNTSIANDAQTRNIANKNYINDLNARNKGQALTNYYKAIEGIGTNTSSAYRDYKAGKQDQDTLDMISQMYPDYKYDKQKKGWFHKTKGTKLVISAE